MPNPIKRNSFCANTPRHGVGRRHVLPVRQALPCIQRRKTQISYRRVWDWLEMAEGDSLVACLFGKPEMCNLGGRDAFPEKGFLLVAIAALSPQLRISRKAAATILWDRIHESGALNNLRQLLARMRHQLPELAEVITVDSREIAVTGTGGSIDICRFMDGKDGSPLALYHGPLLEGLVDVSQASADWLHIERTRLQEQFYRRCEHHLLDLTRLGRGPAETIAAFEKRLLTLEPEREASYRLLIEAYGRGGHVREAARLSSALVAIAKSEHGALPLPETQAAVRRVLATAATVNVPDPVASKQSAVDPPRVAFFQPRWGNIGTEASEPLQALVEDVVNELSRYRTFVMLAPHTSFQIAHDSGVPEHNDVLRSDYTVSGFAIPGHALNLRMVHCGSMEIVWSGEFPVQFEFVAKCFKQLTRRIAEELAGGIERHELAHRNRPESGGAYMHYLLGQRHFKDCNLSNVRRARKHYVEASESGGAFAEAHSGIASTLWMEWLLRGGNDPELLVHAKKQSERAIRLDPNGASGHWRKALVELYQNAFDESEQSFEMAQELNPNQADIILHRSDALGHVGDPVLAQKLFDQALVLNPMPPEHYWWTGASIAFSNEDYAGAIRLCGKIENEEPVLRLLAACHGQLRNMDEARHYGRGLAETYPGETAYQMAKLQPHRTEKSLETFIEGLRIAGVK